MIMLLVLITAIMAVVAAEYDQRAQATGEEYLEHATCETAQKLGVPGMLAAGA